MTFNDYQEQSAETAIYPRESEKQVLSYLALGLNGEAGEVAEHIKKYLRDSTFDKYALLAELGDVLWYLSQLVNELEFDLEDVASSNLNKLKSRMERGVISGSGSDR